MTLKRKNRIIKKISNITTTEEPITSEFTITEITTYIENNEEFIDEYETFEEQWNVTFNCLLGDRFFKMHNIDISKMIG